MKVNAIQPCYAYCHPCGTLLPELYNWKGTQWNYTHVFQGNSTVVILSIFVTFHLLIFFILIFYHFQAFILLIICATSFFFFFLFINIYEPKTTEIVNMEQTLFTFYTQRNISCTGQTQMLQRIEYTKHPRRSSIGTIRSKSTHCHLHRTWKNKRPSSIVSHIIYDKQTLKTSQWPKSGMWLYKH